MISMSPSKMKMVRGGEPQDSAAHREERDEIPKWDSGVFRIASNGQQRLDAVPGGFRRYFVDVNQVWVVCGVWWVCGCVCI